MSTLNFRELYSLSRMVEKYTNTGLHDEKFFYVLLLKYFGSLVNFGVTFSDTVHFYAGDFYENSDKEHKYGFSETGEELCRKSLGYGDGAGITGLYEEFFAKQSDWNWEIFSGSDVTEAKYLQNDIVDPIILAKEFFPTEIPIPQKEDALYRSLEGIYASFFEVGYLYLFWNNRLGSFLKWQKSYKGRYEKIAAFLRELICNKISRIFIDGDWLYKPQDDEEERCIFMLSVDSEYQLAEMTCEGCLYLMLIESMAKQFDRIYHFTTKSIVEASINPAGKERV